jgi:hypothetical protein
VAARGLDGSKAEFVGWWREHVMRLAMLCHQHRNGAASRARLEQARDPTRMRPCSGPVHSSLLRPQPLDLARHRCSAAGRHTPSVPIANSASPP